MQFAFAFRQSQSDLPIVVSFSFNSLKLFFNSDISIVPPNMILTNFADKIYAICFLDIKSYFSLFMISIILLPCNFILTLGKILAFASSSGVLGINSMIFRISSSVKI